MIKNKLKLLSFLILTSCLIFFSGCQTVAVGITPENISISNFPLDGRGNLETVIQDQTSPPVDWYISRKITQTNLSNDIAILNKGTYLQVNETYIITVDDATGATPDIIGNKWIEIWQGSFIYQSEIINVNGNDLTLAVPIDFPFTTEATVLIVDVNQNRDFTNAGIGTQIYSFAPGDATTADFHITRTMITMLHGDESDSSTYGDIQGGLEFGIIFQGTGTLFANETGLPLPLVLANSLLNLKTNGDYKSTAYDVTYDPKSGNPSSPSQYGTSVRKTFNGRDKSGVVIPVRTARNENSRLIFRDDLSDLTLHRVRVIGHIVD